MRDVNVRQFNVTYFDKQRLNDWAGRGGRDGFDLEGFVDEKCDSASGVSVSVFCDESVIWDVYVF